MKLAAALLGATLLALVGCTQERSDYMPGEAREFQGVTLTPMSLQQSNAIKGPQELDRQTYTLTVEGLVDRPLTLSYDDLLRYPMVSKLIILHCVEGWEFNAKWTGPRLMDVLNSAGLKPGARIVIFETADYQPGYSSLTLDYVQSLGILLGMKINDLTLPPERGFPFQVAAEGKFGYKWSKWVTRIVVSDNQDFRGYWETAGYNNDGSLGGPALDPNRPSRPEAP